VSGAFDGLIVDDTGAAIFNDPSSASVTVVGDTPDVPPIPLPASALLLLGGISGLAALRRRRAN
jgi:hypothetical protein